MQRKEDIAIIYHSSENDAEKTKVEIENLNRKCFIFQGDINDYEFCEHIVKEIVSVLGKIAFSFLFLASAEASQMTEF